MNKFPLIKQDDISLLCSFIARRISEHGREVPLDAVTLFVTEVEIYGHPKLDVRASVDIGRKATFVVEEHLQSDSNSAEELDGHARDFAHTINRLWNERSELITMLASIRKVAMREVRNAVRRELPYKLEFVRLAETPAGANDFPRVLVGVQALGVTLLPEIRILQASYPEDLPAAFAGIADR